MWKHNKRSGLRAISPSISSSSASFIFGRSSTVRSFASSSIVQNQEKKGLTFTVRADLEPLLVEKEGVELIHDPLYNKGTGFPLAERDRLNIRGLVPPRCTTIEEQVLRVRSRYLQLKDNVAKYVYLDSLRDRNETLFYRLLMEDVKDLAPIIYTPTVGEACMQFGSQFRRARGMYFSALDRGEMSAMIYNWPEKEVDVIVVTDGSRILGLGDLGVHGMGIPIGKLSLYVAAGGIHPSRVLPITLDVGTNNEKLLNDSLYLGCQHRRLTGDAYFSLVDEFMVAVKLRWPRALVQFEDFSNNTAMALLQKYRNKYTCFNDDIQGTGSVALSGLLCALRAQGKDARELTNQRIVCLGAGSAGLGVVNTIIDGMVEEGLTREEANKRVWLVDINGLLGATRKVLSAEQKPLARADAPDGLSLLETIKMVRPTILLGLSGAGQSFKEEMIKEMAAHTPRPIIFPLSNPTSLSECTAQQAFEWTNGKVIFASGSPFAPVNVGGKTYVPTQGNNMFIYPGIGLGVTFCQSRRVTNSMFYRAAKKLATLVSQEDVAQGKCYPDITAIRDVSKSIAVEVVKTAIEEKLTTMPPPPNDAALERMLEAAMYIPSYVPLIHTPTHYQRSRGTAYFGDF